MSLLSPSSSQSQTQSQSTASVAGASLFDGYGPLEGRDRGVDDALLAADGTIRNHWQRAVRVLDGLGLAELQERKRVLDRMLDDEGVGYRLVDQGKSTRWSLDPVPLLVESAEWAGIEAAVTQRAELLDLVQRDLYGPRDLIDRGLLPAEAIFDHPGFLRECDRIRLPIDQQLFLYAADLARDGDGRFVVMADKTQAPSGAGYALANRVMVSRVFPNLYRDSQVQRVAPYFRSLRAGLERVAEHSHSEDPRIVVLTPGSGSETSFEHAYVGAYLGYPVVEGSDLTVLDGRVYLRALGRLEPVDVILRRVDAEWCDPLELRPDSQLGLPGLIEATRRGTVAVVNPLSAGVLENPALSAFLPALAQHFLGQDLAMASVDTWWCGDPTSWSHVRANLADLVLKPIGRTAGVTSIVGAELSGAELDDLAARIATDPHRWVGQTVVRSATVPAFTGTAITPRAAILRTFAVARGDSYAVMSGGLTRVAPGPGTIRISNQTGASSKDTWVLASEPEHASEFWLRSGPATLATDPTSLSPRAAENLFWFGRYAERAEAATRLLRAVHDRRNDVRDGSGPAAEASLRALLASLTLMTSTGPGFVGPGADAAFAHPDAELRSLACDVDRAGTLAHSVRRMLLAAESVRDQLSLDTWLVVGSMETELQALAAGSVGEDVIAQERLSRVLQHLLAMNGLAAESMVRDAGWHFMDAGRRIERATQLAALLRATLTFARDTAADSLLYESVLVAGESIITYRRRYRSRAQAETLLDLLVADPGNPRSIRYQVDRLAEDIAALPGGSNGGRPTTEKRLALELSTRLQIIDTAQLSATDADGRRGALDAVLGDLIADLWAIGDSVRDNNFGAMLPQQPLTTASGGLS